jgi:hypothetical protein
VHQVLVQWKGESAASATWEDVEPFCAKYSEFQLKDELLLDGGRDVMVGRTYSRRRRARDVRRDAERAKRSGSLRPRAIYPCNRRVVKVKKNITNLISLLSSTKPAAES